jgi:hypothetical protein
LFDLNLSDTSILCMDILERSFDVFNLTFFLYNYLSGHKSLNLLLIHPRGF